MQLKLSEEHLSDMINQFRSNIKAMAILNICKSDLLNNGPLFKAASIGHLVEPKLGVGHLGHKKIKKCSNFCIECIWKSKKGIEVKVAISKLFKCPFLNHYPNKAGFRVMAKYRICKIVLFQHRSWLQQYS